MSKKVDTWMPLLVDKYLGDTQHLTTEQHGAYLLLLMAMWKRDGSLPVRDLPQISKLPPARWKACAPVLLEMFTPSEDGLSVTQKRLTQELERSKAHTEAKSKAGAKGAAKKWGKDDGADGKQDGTAIAEPSLSQWQTGASTPPPSATQIQETALAVSARGLVGVALKAGGINPMTINLADPRIDALITAGATPEHWEGIAREAVKAGADNPIAWVLKVLPARMAKAATTGAEVRASKHSGFATKDYRKGIESDGTFAA